MTSGSPAADKLGGARGGIASSGRAFVRRTGGGGQEEEESLLPRSSCAASSLPSCSGGAMVTFSAPSSGTASHPTVPGGYVTTTITNSSGSGGGGAACAPSSSSSVCAPPSSSTQTRRKQSAAQQSAVKQLHHPSQPQPQPQQHQLHNQTQQSGAAMNGGVKPNKHKKSGGSGGHTSDLSGGDDVTTQSGKLSIAITPPSGAGSAPGAPSGDATTGGSAGGGGGGAMPGNNKAMFACELAMKLLSYLTVVFTFPTSMFVCLKVVAQYERAVIFRLGRLISEQPKGPGLVFVLPCLDSLKRVDLRTFTFNVPTQEVLTKDSVTVAVDAVVYYRIYNPVMSVVNVEDANRSTRLLAQTTLRNVLGTVDLYQLLAGREEIAKNMQGCLDTATEAWGVKVERVDVKDVRLPVQLQRAMAAEAEAAREAKAKVIAAEGEQRASVALKAAAIQISECPIALHLRYLQTLCSISDEKNSTIIFPIPIDLITLLKSKMNAPGGAPGSVPTSLPPLMSSYDATAPSPTQAAVTAPAFRSFDLMKAAKICSESNATPTKKGGLKDKLLLEEECEERDAEGGGRGFSKNCEENNVNKKDESVVGGGTLRHSILEEQNLEEFEETVALPHKEPLQFTDPTVTHFPSAPSPSK